MHYKIDTLQRKRAAAQACAAALELFYILRLNKGDANLREIVFLDEIRHADGVVRVADDALARVAQRQLLAAQFIFPRTRAVRKSAAGLTKTQCASLRERSAVSSSVCAFASG